MFISIGNFSANIADRLSLVNNIHKFTKQSLNVSRHLSMKEWEELFDLDDDILIVNLDILREKKSVFIILDPDEEISGISLRLVEYIKKINPSIHIYMMLVIKDKKSLTKERVQNQNLNLLVWQEIARCGEISRTFLIDLSLVITKFKISLRNFEKTVSDSVSKIVQNCTFILESDPLYGVKFNTDEIRRISTFGVLMSSDLNNLNEEFFFYLFGEKFEGDSVHKKSNLSTNVFTQKHYIFYLNEEELSDGDNTLSKINSLLDSKGRNCSYSIYESGATNSVYYIIKSTSYVELPKE